MPTRVFIKCLSLMWTAFQGKCVVPKLVKWTTACTRLITHIILFIKGKQLIFCCRAIKLFIVNTSQSARSPITDLFIRKNDESCWREYIIVSSLPSSCLPNLYFPWYHNTRTTPQGWSTSTLKQENLCTWVFQPRQLQSSLRWNLV